MAGSREGPLRLTVIYFLLCAFMVDTLLCLFYKGMETICKGSDFIS